MNIIFFGSSNYCLPILKSLFQNFTLCGLITKPKKSPKDDNMILDFAKENNIPTYTPKNKKELLNLAKQFIKLNLDLGVVADYGIILPKQIIEIPKFQIINIHFSALPHLRGSSPVQFSLLLGEKQTSISFMLIDENLDTGNLIKQIKVKIESEDTTASLYTQLFQKASFDLPEIISKYANGILKPTSQSKTSIDYTKILVKEDGFIPFQLIYNSLNGMPDNENLLNDWKIYQYLKKNFKYDNTVVNLISNSIKAFYPWPSVWTKALIASKQTNIFEEKIIKILKAKTDEVNPEKLFIETIQIEGKKPVSWSQFLQAYNIK